MWVDRELLRLWEEGSGCAPLERALLLAHASDPESGREQLLGLSLGQRDRLILDLRRRLMGEVLACQTTCPTCAAPVEFTLQAGTIATLAASRADTQALSFELGGREVTARPPTSADLLALGDELAGDDAERSLARRCILHPDGEAVSDQAPDLTPALLAELNERLETLDPLGNLTIALECPSCSRAWETPLDIVSFLWNELESAVRELLQEVHWLASAYGWSEADILKLGSRRRIYLDLIGA